MARNSRRGNRGNRGKSTNISVDLSGVEVSDNKPIPEGEYPVLIDSTEIKESQSGNDYVKFVFEVAEGKHKGRKLFHNCSLQAHALFSLKSVLMALDFEIPSGAFDLDLSQLEGLSCVVEVAHEKYEGKLKSNIVDFKSLSEDDSDDDEDDDSDEEELLEGLDLDQLKELAESIGIKKAAIKKAKKKDALIELILDHADDEDIDLEDEIDELGFSDDEEDSEDDDEDEDEDDSDDSDDEVREELEELDMKDLKSIAGELGIKKAALKKAKTEEALIDLILENGEADDIMDLIDDMPF